MRKGKGYRFTTRAYHVTRSGKTRIFLFDNLSYTPDLQRHLPAERLKIEPNSPM